MNWLSGFITRFVFNEFVIQCQDPKQGTEAGNSREAL